LGGLQLFPRPGFPSAVLCYADDLVIARAAFKAAVQQWPKDGIWLRQRALIIEDYKTK
jgi:hypothetical protein